MPWNGNGVPVRTDGVRTGPTVWDDAFNAGVRIRADHQDVHDQDLADMVGACVNRDGENAARANLPMGSFKFTGLGNGSARSDSINLGQLQDGGFTWCGTSGGTRNAITLSPSPAIAAYANGQKFRWVVADNNTGPATANVSAKGVIAIEKAVGVPLTGDEMQDGAVMEGVYVSTTPSLVLTGRYVPAVPPGFQRGQELSLAADTEHDITISAGLVCSDDGLRNILRNSGITKRIDATWAEGNDQGGLDAGSVANNTWYSVMTIVAGGVADALFTSTPSAPTMPSGYTAKRHRGWVLTDGSANIIAFLQRGARFLWDVPVRDLSDDVVSASAEIKTITAPPGARPVLALSTSNTSALRYLLVTETAQTDTAAAAGVHTIHSPNRNNGAANTVVLDGTFAIDSSRQLRMRASADVDVNLMTLGWIDERL